MPTTNKKEQKDAQKKKRAPSTAKKAFRGVRSIEHIVKGTGVLPFVKVDTDKKGDVKMTIPRDVGASREMTRSMLGGRPYATVIPAVLTATSSTANTAQAVVLNIDPTATFRWSSWSALFDEARVLYARIVLKNDVVVSGTNNAFSTGAWAFCFDPDNSDVPASVLDVVAASKFVGPISCANGTVAASTNPQPTTSSVTRDGYHHLSTGALVKSVAPNNSSGTPQATGPVQGAWFPTDTTSAIAGYWKIYADALGTNGITVSSGYQFLAMEFRMRG